MSYYAMPEKDPGETLDYSVDWSDWLVSSDTISSGTFVVPTGITQSQAATNTTTKCTIWLSGGTDKADYTLLNKITTANGRHAERSFVVPVRQL